MGRPTHQAPSGSVWSYLAASRVACSGCKPSGHLGLLPTPRARVGWSLQLILLCLLRPGRPHPSQAAPLVTWLEHSPRHLPQANEFKTLAERKEIWGRCRRPPAATKQMWLSSHHLTQPSEYLLIYLLCGQGEESPKWERSQQSHFRNSHSGEGFSFSMSADVTEELEDYFQEMKRFSSVR